MAELPIKRYKLLDAFRGLAILWIVCFHALEDVRTQYGIVFNYIISHGYLGVSVFFVISGYGIAASISREKYQGPLSFLWRRLKRIYLPYWWHLLFAVFIIPILSSMVSMIKSHAFDITFVKYNIIEWFQMITLTKVFSAVNWKLNLAFLPLNGVVWYIAIIVQIYIFVSICLYSKKYSFLLFFGFLLSLLTNIPRVKEFVPYGIFFPYFSQFYIGFVVYYTLRNGYVPNSTISRIFIILLCSSVVFFCAYSKDELLPISFAILIGSLFIVLHAYDLTLSALFVVRLLFLVGTFSYSLYLMHVPLWSFVGMFVRNIVPLPSLWSAPLVLVPGIVILSFIWYLFYEKPPTQQETINRISTPIRTIRSGMNDMLAITNLRRT